MITDLEKNDETNLDTEFDREALENQQEEEEEEKEEDEEEEEEKRHHVAEQEGEEEEQEREADGEQGETEPVEAAVTAPGGQHYAICKIFKSLPLHIGSVFIESFAAT